MNIPNPIEFLRRMFGQQNGKLTPYLIEFRLHGVSKRFASELSRDLTKKFNIKQTNKPGKPAHVTLFGPFYAPDENTIILAFTKFCKKYDLIKYQLDGFDNIDEKVIYLDVKPSEELQELRRELAKEMMQHTNNYPKWDAEPDFIFHTTLTKDFGNKFEEIWNYLTETEAPKFSQYLLRLTLLKNGKILCEYDLIQKKILWRRDALNLNELKHTVNHIKEIRENKGKRKRIDFFEEGKRKVFLISDTHFDHANIIKYCSRPFCSVEEMNKTMVDNWNNTVGKTDVVYFLGDMSFGKGSRPASYWLQQLNGTIIFIEGNHEETGKIKTYPPAYDLVLHYKGNEFFLIHDPAQKHTSWQGWTIHGHVHNHDLENFPLASHNNRTINVSAELVNYTPIIAEKLLELIKQK